MKSLLNLEITKKIKKKIKKNSGMQIPDPVGGELKYYIIWRVVCPSVKLRYRFLQFYSAKAVLSWNSDNFANLCTHFFLFFIFFNFWAVLYPRETDMIDQWTVPTHNVFTSPHHSIKYCYPTIVALRFLEDFRSIKMNIPSLVPCFDQQHSHSFTSAIVWLTSRISHTFHSGCD